MISTGRSMRRWMLNQSMRRDADGLWLITERNRSTMWPIETEIGAKGFQIGSDFPAVRVMQDFHERECWTLLNSVDHLTT